MINILIVDDLSSMRALVRLTLSKNLSNIRVDEAQNGAKAKERLMSDVHYDLVLCDWEMPDVNGEEVLRWMKKNQRLSTIPFIMVTAKNDRKNIENAFRHGVDDYIVKPFSVDVMMEKVNKFLKAKVKDPSHSTNYIGEAMVDFDSRSRMCNIVAIGIQEMTVVFDKEPFPPITGKVLLTFYIKGEKRLSGINGFVSLLEAQSFKQDILHVRAVIKFTDIGEKEKEGIMKFSGELRK